MNKRNSIAYLVNTFLRASESFIYEQILAISEYNVEVLTRSYKNRELFPYKPVNAILEKESFASCVNVLDHALFRHSGYFEDIMQQKNIRLLHAHFGPEGVYALPLKRKFHIPLIVTFHGQDITRLPKFALYPPAWLNYWLHYNSLQNEGDTFLAVSDFLRKKLVEKGFPEERVKTHYLGTHIAKYENNGSRENIILTAGRLVEKKGTEYLIKAMAKIAKTDTKTQLYICGNGPLKTRLEALARELKIENRVRFLGWLKKEEILSWMDRSRVFVLPSITAHDGDCEGLGMVTLEAMSRRLPVIGTMHGGIPETVINGETGFLVPEKDAAQLAEKLIFLLSDTALCDTMGKRGREFLEDKFDTSKQIKKLENIYKDHL